MDYLKINNLLYEYFRRDEDGNVEGIQTALDNVSINVSRGDFISILGANGSGKSTLAKLINALLIPAEGSVIVNGKDTKNPDNTLPVRMETGMIFQNPDNQIVAGVVEEDVAFGPENLGIDSKEIIKRVDEAIKEMDIEQLRKKSPNNLSGGQKQRVAIAGILAMNPKCIIFDEATSMLDPVGREDVLKIAHKLNKENNMTIIFITHNMEEVVDSDWIYVMDEGKIILSGKPKEVFKERDFLRKHGLDVPQILLLSEALKDEGIKIEGTILSRQELIKELVRIKNGNNSK